jgi:YidC/Oxa1 family membrane protein insertase
MKKRTKTILKIFGLLTFTLIIAGCTANFCSPTDQARIMYVYESGDADRNSDQYVPNENLQKIIDTANDRGIATPSDEYWKQIDARVLTTATNRANNPGLTEEQILEQFGYLKFLGTDNDLWGYWTRWTNELRLSLGIEEVPDRDFTELYKSTVNTAYSNFRACIAVETDQYGPNDEYVFEAKNWGYAFDRGIIEGLFVFPVAWLLETFARGFGLGGWGQVLAILFTTLIVRGILMLATFKSTIGMQKMSLLQPELAKIQSKYPNSKTNQYEKQRLAQEQMQFYKKHGVSPFSQIVVLLLQFPIFIAVWGAMTGSAILATGNFLGLNLNSSVGSVITHSFFSAGWWTSLVLFIMMAGSQFLAMKLPTLLQKKDVKKVAKTVKNPSQASQQKQMKIMSNVMLIVIIIMGFSLPSAMVFYWFIGAMVSVAQTLITRKVMKQKK